MKLRMTALALLLTGTAFSMDEYLPVEKGKLEVDVGYLFAKETGFFDGDGERISWDDDPFYPDGYSPATHSIPLQLKYGILKGLDLEFAWMAVFTNEDAGDQSGMYRPEIGVKYADMELGAGVFANFTLPFATGDYDGSNIPAALELGGVYGKRFGDFRLTGLASYEINFESGGYNAGDVFRVLAKPEAMWTEHIGTYLALDFNVAGDAEIEGFGTLEGGYLLLMGPGVNVQLLPNLAYEISVPFAVAGKNASAFWGVGAQLYYTLPY
jgi:hypothetical protein